MLLLVSALAGCAASIGGSPAPESTADPDASAAAPRAAWLDASSFVLQTEGGACAPIIEELVVGDQELDVMLADRGTSDCAADAGPHGMYLGLPAGFDSARPVTVNVTEPHGASTAITLPGLASGALIPADMPADQVPAAAWIDEGELAVLTWGSSTCVPGSGDAVDDGDAKALVRLHEPTDTICTMDYVPRITFVNAPGIEPDAVIILEGAVDDEGNPFVITPVR